MTLAEIRSKIGTKMATVSNNVYSDSRLPMLPDSVKDYVVVSTPMRFKGMTDYSVDSILVGSVVIECFAKNLNSERENTSKLKTMEENASSAIANINPSSDGFRAKVRGYFSAPQDEGFKGIILILDIIV